MLNDRAETLNAMREFAELMKATLAVYGKDASKPVIRIYWNSLKQFDIAMIRQAFSRWMTDPEQGRFSPKPADIIGIIQKRAGGPVWISADEAWSLALPAQDEANTVVWTEEIARAWSAASIVMQEGDPVGARRAFILTYERLVNAARESGKQPAWSVSEGWDPQCRTQVVERAVNSGLLPAPQAHLWHCLHQRYPAIASKPCCQKFRHSRASCLTVSARLKNKKRRNGAKRASACRNSCGKNTKNNNAKPLTTAPKMTNL